MLKSFLKIKDCLNNNKGFVTFQTPVLFLVIICIIFAIIIARHSFGIS